MKRITWCLLVLIAFLSGVVVSSVLIEGLPDSDMITGMSIYSTSQGRVENENPVETFIREGGFTQQEPLQEHAENSARGREEESGKEKASPYDRVSEQDIYVYKDKIIINLENAEWSTFTDTNSMDPVIDKGTNALQIVPKSPDEIHIGDIVSYESDYGDGTVIHRVVEIGDDDLGWYCIMKGDNNGATDPEKVRFSQIKRVVVAIIY